MILKKHALFMVLCLCIAGAFSSDASEKGRLIVDSYRLGGCTGGKKSSSEIKMTVPQKDEALTVSVEKFIEEPGKLWPAANGWRMFRRWGCNENVKYGTEKIPDFGEAACFYLSSGGSRFVRWLPYPGALPNWDGDAGILWKGAEALLLDVFTDNKGELGLTLGGQKVFVPLKKGAQRILIPFAENKISPEKVSNIIFSTDKNMKKLAFRDLKIKWSDKTALNKYEFHLLKRRALLLKHRFAVKRLSPNMTGEVQLMLNEFLKRLDKYKTTPDSEEIEKLSEICLKLNKWYQTANVLKVAKNWYINLCKKNTLEKSSKLSKKLKELEIQLADASERIRDNDLDGALEESEKLLDELDTAWSNYKKLWRSKPRSFTFKGSTILDYAGKPVLPLGGYWGFGDGDTYYKLVDNEENWHLNLEPYFRKMLTENYNIIRMPMYPTDIMPKKDGVINEDYMRYIEWVIDTADKYGIMIDLDLHFYWPQWIRKGEAHGITANPFHFPDKIVLMWSVVAPRFAHYPNVLSAEVPVNEPTHHCSINVLPSLLKRWNEWLLKRYGNLNKLKNAWSVKKGDENIESITSHEDPKKNNIAPPGFSSIDEHNDPLLCPRLTDYLKWTSDDRLDLVNQVVNIIRKSSKGRNIIYLQQPLIGAVYDNSPIPLGLHDALAQIVPPGVSSGTHGTLYNDFYRDAIAPKIRFLNMPTAESETLPEMKAMVDLWKANEIALYFFNYRVHKRPWGYFANTCGDVDPSFAFLPELSEFFINAIPVEKPIKVAVVVNSRLAAVKRETIFSSWCKLLERTGIRYNLVESFYLEKHPDSIKGYKLLVAGNSYASSSLVDILRNSGAYVLWNGAVDATDRGGKNNRDLAKVWKGSEHFFKKIPTAKMTDSETNMISLERRWCFKLAAKKKSVPKSWITSDDLSKWQKKMVPGCWGSAGLPASMAYPIGTGVYRLDVKLPDSWKGKTISFDLGKVDDKATVYCDGKKFEAVSASPSLSEYTIPPALTSSETLKLAVKVYNSSDDGGIIEGPVRLRFQRGKPYTLSDSSGRVVSASTNSVFRMDDIKPSDFMDDVEVLLKDNNGYVWLARQGSQYLYTGSEVSLEKINSSLNKFKVHSGLAENNFPVGFKWFQDIVSKAGIKPDKNLQKGLNIHKYKNYISVTNNSLLPRLLKVRSNIRPVDLSEDYSGIQLEKDNLWKILIPPGKTMVFKILPAAS